MSKKPPPVIDLVSSSEDEDDGNDGISGVGTSSGAGRSAAAAATATAASRQNFGRHYRYMYSHSSDDDEERKRPANANGASVAGWKMPASVALSVGGESSVGRKRPAPVASSAGSKPGKRSGCGNSRAPNAKRVLQAGIVLEEDITTDPSVGIKTVEKRGSRSGSLKASSSDEGESEVNADGNERPASCQSYVEAQLDRVRCGLPPLLYHDRDFKPIPTSIDGMNSISPILDDDKAIPKSKIVKCRCSPAQAAVIAYSTREGPNMHRPYYTCAKQGGGNKCKFFQWAFNSHTIRWQRFGTHSGHTLVGPAGFRADALVQGKVGDCWFLSALAVVAERPDLISRLFGTMSCVNKHGIAEVRLFVDGFWRNVIIDNFLPCFVDPHDDDELGRAIQASLGSLAHEWGSASESANGVAVAAADEVPPPTTSSRDPHALSESNLSVIRRTYEYFEQDRYRKNGPLPPGQKSPYNRVVPRRLPRTVQTEDLAYSKAKHDQLWVPLLEKAYAKMHGCYKAISGGHIAEAFLDLTGAPTIVYSFDAPTFNGRAMWADLMYFRARRLPMGCGTDSSAVGIIGMHAYSILDVREVRDVSFDFFRDSIGKGTHGNVSGFTEFDGVVRLLRIRNPHGRSEWKGDFSDGSQMWEKLLASRRNVHTDSPALERTMSNDGTFWIDYDNFLMGFSNVDVVLAFEGKHAKSFASNFPLKKSTHRCTRAFEVSLLDEQPGVPSKNKVEVYVMGIQGNKRGSNLGRSDRKKSYKISDLGILFGKHADGGRSAFEARSCDEEEEESLLEFDQVDGHCFGFRRNGHYRLTLDQNDCKSLVVMPISFGHPAATDEERSFALRFVADAPVMIRELAQTPRMDKTLNRLFFAPKSPNNTLKGSIMGTSSRRGVQGAQRVIYADTEGKRKYGEQLFRVVQIDYLANEGGVVFCYLVTNDKLLQKHKELQDYSVSLSIEATCRGMICRTADGLPQHETVAKGKRFEAAWRKYACLFENEHKSRLLMVLVQSGQSTEFGHIKCEQLADTGGSSIIGGAVKAGTLTNFLGVSASKLSRARDTRNYEALGIFNGVAFDDTSFFQRNLPTPDNSVAIIDLGGISGASGERTNMDQDLERALEMSRQDADLHRAIEQNKSDDIVDVQNPSPPSNNFDDDMAAAIAASMASASTPGIADSAYQRDLELAMKLSEQQSKADSTCTGEVKGNGASAAMDREIVDFLDDGDGDMIESIRGDVKSPQPSKENEEPALSGNEARENPSAEDIDRASPKVDDAADAAEKRRLAAEAAMKRFAIENGTCM